MESKNSTITNSLLVVFKLSCQGFKSKLPGVKSVKLKILVLQWGNLKADFKNSEQAAILSLKLRFQKFYNETKGKTFIYAIKTSWTFVSNFSADKNLNFSD